MPKAIPREQRLSIKMCYFELKSAHADSNPDVLKTLIYQKVSNIFDLHVSTIRRIIHEEDIKDYPAIGRPKKAFSIDDYIFRKDLQRQIWKYNLKNEYFSIDTLLSYAKENLEYNAGRTSLFKILKSMGYKYQRVNERKFICERKNVVGTKITFLRKFLQYKTLEPNIRFVFVDDTWFYLNSPSAIRSTNDSDETGNPSKIKSEEKRITILHASSNSGFLEGCELILNSKPSDEYHKTLTSEIFQKWASDQLIPALAKIPEKCVVVLDNAPYHNAVPLDKPPKFTSKKTEMQDWLTNNKIHFNQNFNKKQLWHLILPYRTDKKKRFVVDDLLKKHGHEVLRLPQNHSQYNPMEKAWEFCKNFYNENKNSIPDSGDNVMNLWRLATSKCTSDMWQNFYLSCEKLMTEDWTKHMGNLSLSDIPPFIISLEESDSESELSDDESDPNNEVMDAE